MLAPLLALIVNAGPAPATPPAAPATTTAASTHLKVLVLDVNSTDLTASEKVTLANLEAAHLGEDGRLDVLSGEDVKQLVALSGQAQAIGVSGCTEACMAEVAGRLGAGVVVSTQAGKLGDTLVVTLAVFDAAKAKSVARKSLTAQSLGELPARIAPALDDLMRPLLPQSVRLAALAPPSTERADQASAAAATAATTATPPVQTRVVPAAAAAAADHATPPVQTRVVASPTAPPPPTTTTKQPPAEPAEPTTSSADDDLWVIMGVTVGAVVVVVLVVVLLASESESGSGF